MRKDDISLLMQLNETLEETLKKIIESYNKQDILKFNEMKRLFIRVQKKIDEVAS